MQRTVTFTKSGENVEKVQFRPGTENGANQFHSPSKLCGTGRRYQNHSGGCDRQQDVKLELQMNKVICDVAVILRESDRSPCHDISCFFFE